MFKDDLYPGTGAMTNAVLRKLGLPEDRVGEKK